MHSFPQVSAGVAASSEIRTPCTELDTAAIRRRTLDTSASGFHMRWGKGKLAGELSGVSAHDVGVSTMTSASGAGGGSGGGEEDEEQEEGRGFREVCHAGSASENLHLTRNFDLNWRHTGGTKGHFFSFSLQGRRHATNFPNQAIIWSLVSLGSTPLFSHFYLACIFSVNKKKKHFN